MEQLNILHTYDNAHMHTYIHLTQMHPYGSYIYKVLSGRISN